MDRDRGEAQGIEKLLAWGVWDGGLWFSTGAKAVTGRNLARDPHVAIHLESGDDVVILEGSIETCPQPEVPAGVMSAYAEKYGFDPIAEDAPEGTWHRLVPSLAHTWLETDFQNSVGRWEFN